jgi:diacylglycerol kinase (CTP)
MIKKPRIVTATQHETSNKRSSIQPANITSSQIHRHELPRKALHLSIGFLTLHLYSTNTQTISIHPLLLRLLIPIALTDLLRFSYAPFNTFYIRCLGPFMRESEAHEKWNGVIWYLLGTWTVMRWCPKDVACVAVCLLSWCDTAASTVGRTWGRKGPKVRQGKSVAGSAAALVVGIATSLVFWGWWAPRCMQLGYVDPHDVKSFAFRGVLSLPGVIRDVLGWTTEEASITGGLALVVMSTVAGVVACVSEATDVFGLDDNVTIPVLSGLGLWAFLRVFGGW